MKSVNHILFLCALAMMMSCQHAETEEPEMLISQIDGQDYLSTMQGEMTTQKALLLIQQNWTDSLTQPDFMLLAKDMNAIDSITRSNCFQALSQTFMYIIPNNYPLLEGMIFTKLMHYPIETIVQLQQTQADVHDFWMMRLYDEFERQIASPEITAISVVNLLLKNCPSCSKDEQEDIIAFIDYLQLYITN
jgi:hypothetical protein